MSDFTAPRISEKKFYSIPDTAFTADGTADGIVTLPSTFQYKVGMIISLSSATQSPRRLKIKRVISDTQMHVGTIDTKIDIYADLSMFLVSDTAIVSFTEQQRPVIDILEIQRQVYEEEPTVALRNHLVDWQGRSYDKENPVPVQLSDGSINIGSVNAELEVQLSHKDNYPDTGDVADSVRIGDGTDELKINSDGSINVVPAIDPALSVKSFYGEITSVPHTSLTTILSYTVPIGVTSAALEVVTVSGTNIATYHVEVNSATVDKKRTYFGGALNDVFKFNKSVILNTGDIVRIRVEHSRSMLGDFNARLSLTEKN